MISILRLHGAQVFYYTGSMGSETLASGIQDQLVRGLDPEKHRQVNTIKWKDTVSGTAEFPYGSAMQYDPDILHRKAFLEPDILKADLCSERQTLG